jgi:hypothetical protein
VSIAVYVEIVHVVGLFEAACEVDGEDIYLTFYFADIVVYKHLGGGDQVQLHLIKLEVQTLHLEVLLLQQHQQIQLIVLVRVLLFLIFLQLLISQGLVHALQLEGNGSRQIWELWDQSISKVPQVPSLLMSGPLVCLLEYLNQQMSEVLVLFEGSLEVAPVSFIMIFGLVHVFCLRELIRKELLPNVVHVFRQLPISLRQRN